MSKTGARKVGCKANTLGKASIDDIADKLYEKKKVRKIIVRFKS